MRENFLCSFTLQILRYMRRIRNSIVITNGEQQKIWQKTVWAPLKVNLLNFHIIYI